MTDINEEITTRTQWREAVKLYRSSATIHGISRIGEPHLYSCGPITWVFLTLTMASVLLAMLFLQFTKYAEYPTLTKIDAVFNKKLDFPAVTVCNLNMFHRSIMNCTGPENADKMYTFFKTLSNVGVLHGILNISKESVTSLSGEELKQCALEYSYKRSTLIVQCVWEGTIQNCSDIFESTTTRYGICFTFNKNSDSLRFTESYGSDSGLHILINLNQDEYFFSRSLQAGVKIILHEPEENPRPMSRGIYVGPGMSAAIAIQKEKVAIDTTKIQFAMLRTQQLHEHHEFDILPDIL